MSHNTIHASDRLHAMRGDYLKATFDRQETIDRWKKRESARGVLKTFMVISLLLGLIAAAALWYVYQGSEGYMEWIMMGVGLAAGVLICIILGLIRRAVNASCEKLYVRCFVTDMHVQDGADQIKSEAIDPVLKNSIVISIHSYLVAPAEYEEVDGDDDMSPEDYTYAAAKGINGAADDLEYFDGPVNAATVFVDDVEVGAVDLGSEFSVFRVNPGLHTLKIRIRKEYPHFGKTLNIETPVASVYIDNDYRIFRYTVDAKSRDNVHVSYELKLAEYDDMAVFRRDVHDADRLEMLERDADLSPKLRKRAKELYEKLSIQEKYIATFRAEEEKRYLRQKYRWDNLNETQIDPRILRSHRAAARDLNRKIMEVENDPTYTENRKNKMLSLLNRQMDELVLSLYNKLGISGGANMTKLQATRLKNILLFGQENLRYEDLAQRLHNNSQDARLTDNKKPQIVVNVHNNIRKESH